MADLNPQQFLPGTEHLRPAEPHEQTEAQFMNRPDVWVHGRIMGKDVPLNRVPKPAFDFHAGTREAAIDRVEQLGAPRRGDQQHERFFAGRVDPSKMHNTPETRIPDANTDWNDEHLDHYYRNDSEAPGSTSVILTPGSNFRTHRGLVTEALASGKAVPSHVKAVYDVSGAAGGSKAHFDTGFRPQRANTGYQPALFAYHGGRA